MQTLPTFPPSVTVDDAGRMRFEGLLCSALAEQYGTPAYVYSAPAIRANYRAMDQAIGRRLTSPYEIFYAYKGNSCPAVCKVLHNAGAGAEVVSLGELHQALLLGVPPRRIVFNNVVKTDEELEYAIRAGIGLIVIDSESELEAIGRIAGRLRRVAEVAFRVRPFVRAGFHKHVSTGHEETKFGFSAEALEDVTRQAAACRQVRVRGLHTHIGSQNCDPGKFLEAADVVFSLTRRFRERFGFPVEVVDLGGGMGIQNEDLLRVAFDFDALALGVEERLAAAFAPSERPAVFFEPNRILVADASILLGRVVSLKQDVGKRFVGVDIGYSTFVRCMLYGAFHDLRNVDDPCPDHPVPCEVIGPLCETGDVLGSNLPLPPPKVGDVLALLDAGAYGYAQASHYNSRPRPVEVLVDGGETFVVRHRETLADVLGRFEIPAHLQAGYSGS
jgi:diaminopimelate decarboxylase